MNCILSKIFTRYDPIANKWTERAPLNKYRRYFGCTVFNRMLYVVGSYDYFFHPVALVDKYNPSINKFT